MYKSYYYLIILFLGFHLKAQAQTDSLVAQTTAALTISAFLDVFYGYDFNRPETTKRQPFLYNHNRHNEFNLNLGLLKLSKNHSKYRANLALQAGTYAIDNYAAESPVMQHVYEANAGLALNNKKNLWLDAGIFGSHIGFESAVSKDNWTLTRSLLAENSPYYLTGAKITYSPNEHWRLAGIICNGWQRIQRLPGNSLPSFCSQVTFTSHNNTILNWSTFLGYEKPDSTRQLRYFNNFYSQIQLSGKVGLIAGFDVGFQQKQKGSRQYNIWLSPVVITRYTLAEKWAAAFRAEYYLDKNEVIVEVENANGFKTGSISGNLDFNPVPNVLLRIENRWFWSFNNAFRKENEFKKSDCFIVGSLAISI